MKKTAFAIQLSESIAIRNCKDTFQGKLLFSDTDELFYELKKGQYLYIFKYGVVCFYNIEEDQINEISNEILVFGSSSLDHEVSESTDIRQAVGRNKVELGYVLLQEFSIEAIRLIMLNISQSVALDHYANISEQILEDTRTHTSYLEMHGKLDISGKKLKKYIGRVLNIKNKISENLYIFDSPDVTWEDENLNKLDQDFKRVFDIKDRYRSIHDQIEVIKENLDLFKDIMFHRESSRLEWIIILLILVEVVDLFIQKII